MESVRSTWSPCTGYPGAGSPTSFGNGKITGDRLLDSLYTIVGYHIADVVTSSWFIGWSPVPKSLITAWEGVLQRAAVEGITVNFASGTPRSPQRSSIPAPTPWSPRLVTTIAVGAYNNYL